MSLHLLLLLLDELWETLNQEIYHQESLTGNSILNTFHQSKLLLSSRDTIVVVLEQILSSQRVSCGRFRDIIGAKLTALRNHLSVTTTSSSSSSD